jgi:hypothetical protein
MRECPQYPSCAVNHCPLDPAQDQHLANPDDKERKCPMEKGVRHRIGQKYPDLLPLLGLTKRESAGLERWNQMTPDQRSACAERGRIALSKLRKV